MSLKLIDLKTSVCVEYYDLRLFCRFIDIDYFSTTILKLIGLPHSDDLTVIATIELKNNEELNIQIKNLNKNLIYKYRNESQET